MESNYKESEIANKHNVIDPNESYARAYKCTNYALALGILFSIYMVLMTIALIIRSDDATKVAVYLSGAISIANLVLSIILVTRWKNIKDHTKLNHLFILIAYPIGWAIDVVLSIFLLVYANQPIDDVINKVTVILILDIVMSGALAGISYYIFAKMNKTIHK